MPIIKNPFKKQDENAPPAKTPVPSAGIDIKQSTEYKLSEISNTGEYLPVCLQLCRLVYWLNRVAVAARDQKSVLVTIRVHQYIQQAEHA